ncbi:hypothetical protein D3C77_806580 [compost metagenome]
MLLVLLDDKIIGHATYFASNFVGNLRPVAMDFATVAADQVFNSGYDLFIKV